MNVRQIGVILSYFNMGIQIIVSLLYVPLLLSFVGTNEYGLYQLMGSIMAYLQVMNTTLSAGVQRFYCKYLAEKNINKQNDVLALSRRIYRGLSLLVLVLGVVIAPLIMQVYSSSLSEHELHESIVMLFVIVANVMVLLNNSIYDSAVIGNERFVFYQGSQIAIGIAQPVAVCIVLNFYPHALTVVSVQLVLNFFLALAKKFYVNKRLNIVVKFRHEDKFLSKQILVFSSSVLLVAIADQIFWRADQFILAFFLGTSGVAIYSIGSQIFMCYMPLGTAIASVFMPEISRLYLQDRGMENISELFINVGRIAFFVLSLVLTGFITFGQKFINLWAGPGFEESFWVALVVMIPFTIDLIQNIGLTILQVIDKYSFRAKMYALLAISNIFLTIALIKPFGIVGAAFATGLSMFIGNGLVMNYYYWKKIGLNIPKFWLNIAKIGVPVSICSVAGFFLFNCVLQLDCTWLSLLVQIFCYSVFFFVIQYFFSFNASEKRLIKNIFNRKKRA